MTEAHQLDAQIDHGVVVLFLKRQYVPALIGNIAEIIPQIAAELLRRFLILHFHQMAKQVEAVVKKMRVDLGLQVLHLRVLQKDGLLIVLFDQPGQLGGHSVEMTGQPIELIGIGGLQPGLQPSLADTVESP